MGELDKAGLSIIGRAFICFAQTNLFRPLLRWWSSQLAKNDSQDEMVTRVMKHIKVFRAVACAFRLAYSLDAVVKLRLGKNTPQDYGQQSCTAITQLTFF